MADEFVELRARSLHIKKRYLEYTFSNERAKEFAWHGFLRRFGTLVRCIENTFCAIPPEFEGVPTLDQTEDAAIQVQAFLFNIFGCLDNLALMWVHERNITKLDGKPLHPKRIGLRAVDTHVRDSFGQELRQWLAGISGWFKYLEDFRNALAHRIPLYIPPFSIAPDDGARYIELEQSITRSLIERNQTKMEALKAERDSLRFFHPCIAHSWSESARPLFFHTQMLTDFKTIETIGVKLLEELGRPSASVLMPPRI